MINITIWSDFACPYCYLGEMRLANAIRELGIEDQVDVTFRSFELDPTAPIVSETNVIDRLVRHMKMPEYKARKKMDDISQLGRDMGLDFDYGNSKYSNTRTAHRLMKLAQDKYDKETVYRLNMGLFDAYFGKNLLIGDDKVLTDVALAAGLNGADVAQVLTTDKYDHDVMEDEHYASMHGIDAVPRFVFNDKYNINGAVQTEDFKNVLMDLLHHEPVPERRQGSHEHVCDHKGCQFA